MKIQNILLSVATASSAVFAATAHQNQVGFLTNGQKQIVITDAAGKDVVFKDESGKAVLTVTAPDLAFWGPANDSVSLVDFSKLTTAGTYQAYVGNEAVGFPIIIKDNAYEDVAKASLKFFYFQRASTELTEEYAGIYARAAGHPDTSVMYYDGLGKDPAATFNGSKGWYDAGDFGKYIVNSGITTYTLLQLYKLNQNYFKTLDLNIPESKNEVPDILDEIRWNLEWMLTMQDDDGGVFHKLTTKNFAGTVMPEKAVNQRYAIGKSVTATFNFVSVMAEAATIYRDFDKDFAEKCIKAAQKAYNWGLGHPYDFYAQPRGVGTGTYIDDYATDEQYWAAVEMHLATQNENYLKSVDHIKYNKGRAELQSWSSTFMLPAFTIVSNPNSFSSELVDTAKTVIDQLAKSYVQQLKNNGYGVVMRNSDFFWGSNSVAANKGMVLIYAYITSMDSTYLNAAIGLLDYLLGRNPLDVSYLTGFGVNPVMNPHHRISSADGIEAPVPGMLSGGPNASPSDISACKGHNYKNAAAPALSFYDNNCSYASNEVAINWNAPFAFLAGTLQSFANPENIFDGTTIEKVKPFETTESIKANKPMDVKPAAGNKLIIRNGSVQIKKTMSDGSVRYFNLKGKKI